MNAKGAISFSEYQGNGFNLKFNGFPGGLEVGDFVWYTSFACELSNAQVRGETIGVFQDVITFWKLGLEGFLKGEEGIMGLRVEPHRESALTVGEKAESGESEGKGIDVRTRLNQSRDYLRKLSVR